MERTYFQRGPLRLSVARTGAGRAFVFQHGLCGTASQPAEVFPHESGWQCLTLECRGHGLSDAGDPDLWSIATFSNDVAAFIDDLGVGPVVLGGISMGAAIALRLAVRRPDLVGALVLARPAWFDRPAPDNLAPNVDVGRLLGLYPPQEALDRFDRSPVAARLAAEAPDNLASLRGFFSRDPIEGTRAMLAAIGIDGPGVDRDEIARIDRPMLVIGHERDMIHPIAIARALADASPRARLVEIPAKADGVDAYRAGFRRALSQFLGDLP